MNRTFPSEKTHTDAEEGKKKKKKWPNVVWFKVQLCKEKEVRLDSVHHVCGSVKQARGN